MKNMPMVSVIIPMYNAEKYIEETLNSLLNQEYSNIEVIIVDNASTDNSVSIVNSYKSKLSLKLIECSKNSGGPAKPRNVGIENSHGEYIAFLDADDLWDANKLTYQIDVMIENKHNFTCISPVAINEESQKYNRFRDNYIFKKNKVYGVRSLLFRNTITTSSVVVSRDLLADSRFSESESMVTCEDYLLWLNLLNKEKCSFLHLTKKLVSYRVILTSLGNSSGMHMFALKSLLVSSDFLVKNKKQNLMYISVISNLFRLLKLFIVRSK